MLTTRSRCRTYIEHSVDPSADLRRSTNCSSPEAILALSTGDVGSLVARLSGLRWHLLTRGITTIFFQPYTLGRMLERAEFSVVSVARRQAGTRSCSASKPGTMIDRPAVTHVY